MLFYKQNIVGIIQNKKNKPRMRGPPLCVRVSGVRVEMNLWQKVFAKKITGKITKSQLPPLCGMGKTVKTWSAIDKNEFWGKKFFEKKFWKISKSLLRPRGPIWP